MFAVTEGSLVEKSYAMFMYFLTNWKMFCFTKFSSYLV
jgi:hypothetical protein